MNGVFLIDHVAQRDDGCGGAEILITVASRGDAGSVFRRVAEHLRANRARILAERIMVPRLDVGLQTVRAAAYGSVDDGGSATWLAPPAASIDAPPLVAVQVHAVVGCAVECRGPVVRVARHPRQPVVAISGLQVPAEDAAGECRAAYAALGRYLADAGSALDRTARTWLWLDPIYTHYAALNRERNACFTTLGLISGDGTPLHLPASTGIGLRSGQARFQVEAIAPIGGSRPRPLQAAGNQDSALRYGSAFSRAMCMQGMGGTVVYVSGTAAIDLQGRTVAVGDAARQVALTIANVRAVLADAGVGDDAIVQGCAYCLDPVVDAAWASQDPGWPLVPLRADICRPDLLFEIEVTAWA